VTSPPARGPALLERSVVLPPRLASAGAARRLLREALERTDRERWRTAGDLAVSELVTNAVLHAHTDVHVRVTVRADRVDVEVEDGNPVRPEFRRRDEQATTGRGLGLIAALASDCGVRSVGDTGKVVWFSVRDDDAGDELLEPDLNDLLAAWDLSDDAPPPPVDVGPAPRTVLLRDMPALLWVAARQHHDALLRELVLYRAEHDELEVDLALADRARGVVSRALAAELEQAERDGRARQVLPPGYPSPLPLVPDHLDLPVVMASDLGPAFAALQDALDAAERLALAGRLLVHPGLPEVVAVRDWLCDQVVAQLAGVGAVAWPGTDQDRFELDVRDRSEPSSSGWQDGLVTASDRGVVAADEANRIVAVSRPLARDLGWEVEDLVGRRVVALVPHELREAHVAGFTRHLSTGEAHVLGVPVDLPVLRRDGSQVTRRFLVERAPDNVGRSVYLAWIEPLPGGSGDAA
jgi:PAS domain S-box-containing protein